MPRDEQWHKRLFANINYYKTLLKLEEMLGRLLSDRTFSADFYKSKTIKIPQLSNIIHISTINKYEFINLSLYNPIIFFSYCFAHNWALRLLNTLLQGSNLTYEILGHANDQQTINVFQKNYLSVYTWYFSNSKCYSINGCHIAPGKCWSVQVIWKSSCMVWQAHVEKN